MKSKTTQYLLIAVLCSTMFFTFTSFSLGAQNNLKTSQDHLFDGLWANYTHVFGTPTVATFTYTYESGTLYNVTWQNADTPPPPYSWLVDTETRLTSSDIGGFGSGVHTPMWMFTNLTVGNSTSIAVDGAGDHPYLVTDELVVNYPGFGNIEVMVLEDQWYFVLAWYEKSTGLLINGTFQWFAGSYTFDLLSTNIFPAPGGAGIPAYEIFLVLPLIGIISFFILKKRLKMLKVK